MDEELESTAAEQPVAEVAPAPVEPIAPLEPVIAFTRSEVQSLFNSAEALMDSVLNHPEQRSRVQNILDITQRKLSL
jgi:hypothetical protein